jgi:hypothetical protein
MLTVLGSIVLAVVLVVTVSLADSEGRKVTAVVENYSKQAELAPIRGSIRRI